MNEKVRHLEYQNKLLEVQKKLDQQKDIMTEKYKKWEEKKEGPKPIVSKVQIIQPHRVLIFTQNVMLVDQDNKETDIGLYLTNDLIFWCEEGETEDTLSINFLT
jgi:hypothetical protein